MPPISRNWCLFLDNGRELLAAIEGGEIRTAPQGREARELVRQCDDFVCFTNQPKAILALCDARYFQGKQRRERLLEIRCDDGPKIGILPRDIVTGSTIAYVSAFSIYTDWLRSHGTIFDKRAGWGTIGRRLWKATDGQKDFYGPGMARLAFYGGRKQAPFPTTYQRANHYDISAAYLHAIGSATIPSKLKPSPLGEWKTASLDGIAYARVTIPESIGEWLPLPRRSDKRIVRLISFGAGELEGAWPFSELRMAAEYGCKVEVLESWAGQYAKPYFSEWYSTMLEGRSLPSGAAAFAKHHANLLWSSFATGPSRIVYKRWSDEYGRMPIIVKEQKPGLDFSARTIFVSAIVAARVRERLYREVLNPNGNPNLFVVHCDTDGIVCGTRHHLPEALQNGSGLPGQWRHTKFMPYVEVKSPNAYRYTCNDCGDTHMEWHYNCAGATNEDSARRFFKNEPRTWNALDLDSLEPETLPDVLAEYRPKRRMPKHAVTTS